MKPHAYLIMAHEDPSHLERLIQALSAQWAHFFVHVDGKADIAPFAELRNLPNVELIERRVPVYWGGWSQVEAAIYLIQCARNSNLKFEYFTLLSGSHFPIATNERIYETFSGSGKEFINMVAVPSKEMNKPKERFQQFFFEGAHRAHFCKRLPAIVLTAAFNLLVKRDPDRDLNGLRLFAGSQWWTLSDAAIETIEKFINERPDVVKFFRHVKIPDESFFQTIIGNTSLIERVQRGTTYTDWSNPKEAPCFIRDDHLNFLLSDRCWLDDSYGSGPVLFARKFGGRNISVVERIQQQREGILDSAGCRSTPVSRSELG